MIKQLWSEIDAWLMSNAPDVARSLRPGATKEQLDSLRKALPAGTPEELFEHLACHDGQDFPRPQLFVLEGLIDPVPPLRKRPGSDNYGWGFYTSDVILESRSALEGQVEAGIFKDSTCTSTAFPKFVTP
jgi:hypothetical protein